MSTLPVSSLQTGSDVDLANFNLQMRNKAGIKLISAITDATIERTIEGASTLTVELDDDLQRTIENSGRLGRKVDVNVDGLWWTLVGVRKRGRHFTLTFEEREVNALRYHNRFIMMSRDEVTRAEFVLRMILEVKEVPIKYKIPELTTVQQIDTPLSPGDIFVNDAGAPLVVAPPTDMGVSQGATGLTVKGKKATVEQINNANICLQQARVMGANGKVMVCTIMTAITESTLHNYTNAQSDPGTDSVGVFQQRKSMGWPATRNVATDAAEFIKRCMDRDKKYPNESYAQLCQDIQHSAFSDGSNYAPWQSEAEAFVQQFGIQPPSAAAVEPTAANNQASAGPTAEGQFYTRGQISQKDTAWVLTPEDSWTCMTRLAGEVGWRCFCVAGVIYFVSEQWLFRSKPFMTISEDSVGIDWIDYDYDEGKREATVTVTAHLSRWSAPPGSIVKIEHHYIVNGRWIVNDVSRSIYETIGTITLKKPLPVLPEPVNLSNLPQGFMGPPPTPAAPGQSEAAMTDLQNRIVAYAKSQLNVPYQYGAESPGEAFDCSGLAQAAYDSVGISIPRVAADQYAKGPAVPRGEVLAPGDLVFFGPDPKGIHHVGIYIGNGAMIDAPHTGANVRVDYNFQSNWGDYYGATRPWQKGDVSSTARRTNRA